jgi:hypothetical protein
MASSFRERFESIILGCFGSALFWIVLSLGTLTVAVYSGYSAHLHDVPAYKAIAWAAGVLLVFVLSLYLLGLVIARYRKPCPDTWLHAIAEDQRQNIGHWVRVVDCRIEHHELLRGDPYIDFIFYVHNDSIYNVCLDNGNLGGSIFFDRRQLSGQLRWSENPNEIPFGTRNTFIIQLSLGKEDVVHILNASTDNARFDFRKLEVTVKGGSGFKDALIPKQLRVYPMSLTNVDLLKAYPKLKIDIQKDEALSLFDIPDDVWQMECVGTVITLKVHFVSHRAQPILIQQFRVTVRVDEKTYAVNARMGELSTKIEKRNGEIVTSAGGTKLNNLSSGGGSPLVIESEQDFDGWIQFIFEGPPPKSFNGGSGRLIILDVSGEEHSQEFAVNYAP